jgi:hypothetical protein
VSTIAALATRALGTDFDSGYQADAERYVRAAISKIFRSTTLARADYVPAAITLGVGSTSTTLPETGIRVDRVWLADTGAELRPVEVADIRAAQSVATPARGRPVAFAVTGAGLTSEGVALTYAPIPDQAYQLMVSGHFSPGATDLESTDVAPLPVDYEELPVYWAKHELYSNETDSEAMNLWLGKWTTGILELRGDLQHRTTGNRQVPGHWSGGSGGPQFHHPKGLF